MTHLHDTEFADLLDGTLHATRVVHVDSCDQCRARADAARAMLAAVASTPVDEPSPLYWDGFASRVRERIDAPAFSRRWFAWPRFAFVGIGALVVIILAWKLPAPGVLAPGQPDAPFATVADVPLYDDLDADQQWAVVRAAAEGLDIEEVEAEGLSVRPGSAERLAMELTAAERAELIRILQEEFKAGA